MIGKSRMIGICLCVVIALVVALSAHRPVVAQTPDEFAKWLGVPPPQATWTDRVKTWFSRDTRPTDAELQQNWKNLVEQSKAYAEEQARLEAERLRQQQAAEQAEFDRKVKIIEIMQRQQMINALNDLAPIPGFPQQPPPPRSYTIEPDYLGGWEIRPK